MSLITIIVPCYNEEEALPIFYDEFNKVANEMSSEKFELLLVNDGSKDNTLSVMKSFAAKDERIKYISFSRFEKQRGRLCCADGRRPSGSAVSSPRNV